MTRIPTTTVLAGAAALLAATPSLADNTVRTVEQEKALYELQESCGKDAAAFYAQIRKEDDRAWLDTGRAWVDGVNGLGPAASAQYEAGALVRYDYENNYSRNLKGCFILVKYEGRWREFRSIVHAEELWAVTSHRRLGHIRIQVFPSEALTTTKFEPVWLALCRFANKDCDVGKWNMLIKPYMSESE